MDAFIYVFNKDASELLTKEGYELVKADDRNSVYIFRNKAEMSFALSNISYLTSNTLSF
jgi:hypothetical protein